MILYHRARVCLQAVAWAVLTGGVLVPAAADEALYLQRGSIWKYFRGQAEASSPDTTEWREFAFDDGSWASGPAPFGYGDPPFGTELTGMRNNYSTLFLRRTFEVTDPDAIVELQANIDYDDGFSIWINDIEVLRENIDPGEPNYDDLASELHESGAYDNFDLPNPQSFLQSGTNVIAVQVFNATITSSDLKFDLELVDPFGPDVSPPVIAQLTPAPGTVVRRLTQVEVLFSEDVTGVDAGDLLLNGVPATDVSGQGSGPFVFRFDPPPDGLVQVEWGPGHGISDLANPANPFAGGSWSYTLDPNAPLADLVITEFLATNLSGLADEDGERSGWIEVSNRGSTAVEVSGWALTDDSEDLGKWVLPSVTLAPQAYLVVFTSAKDRAPTSGNLHANFKLNPAGEYLALSTAESPRRVVSEFARQFPEQRPDISYGLDPTSGVVSYFDPPTPGARNTTAVDVAGVVPEPVFTVPHGLYDAPLDVAIVSPMSGAVLYYTLDGSEPTPASGIPYAGAIRVAGTSRRAVVTLRAAAFKDGYLPSNVATSTYIYPEHVLSQPPDPDGFPNSWPGTTADYELDPRVINSSRGMASTGLASIPSISVVSETGNFFDSSRGIYANASQSGPRWERPTSAELIFPDGRPGFQIDCGIRIQGGSSTGGWKSKKLSMRLLFKGDYGETKLGYPLFGDSFVDTFDSILLDAHLNLAWTHPSHDQRVRSQYVRDMYVSDLQLATGSLAPHSFLCNLYINGLFWGVYDIHERPDGSYAAEYLGGQKEEYDVLRHSGSTIVDGNGAAWNTMMGIARGDLSSNARYEDLQQYLDVGDLCDYMIVNLYVGNDDWPRHNWYAARRRVDGAQWRFFSWDAEHVLKSATINQTGVNNTNSPAEIYSRLRSNAEFRLLFADHVHRHFFNGGPMYVDPDRPEWDPEAGDSNVPAAMYWKRIEEIDPAIVLESARWGDVRRPDQPYVRDVEFLNELDWLLEAYFPRRSENVLGQFRNANLYPAVGAPIFSRHGGRIGPGFGLTMILTQGASGTVYYTTDGSDPRLYGSGDVSPTATLYSDPVVLNDSTLVKARTLSGGVWSALNEAVFTVIARQPLRISEIMYNPLGGSRYEFIEIENTADVTVFLSGLRFSAGVDFTFPWGAAVGPGEFVVLVSDAEAFASLYPDVAVGGVYRGNLSNAGELLTLSTGQGVPILSFEYDDEGFWPIAPDGMGHSLVLADFESGADLDDPSSWRASAELNGSPWSEDPPPRHGGVVINEVLTASSEPLEDAIELHNPTVGAIDIGGWFLSDDRGSSVTLRKFRIPDGTVIPGGGYQVFYEFQFNAEPGVLTSFALNSSGDDVYLSAADAVGNLTGYIVGHEFEAAEDGVSFGMHTTSAGPEFSALRRRTLGVDDPATVEQFRQGSGVLNSPPLVGAVVVNEIHYHPRVAGIEFIELLNRSGEDVELHDADLQRGWRLTGVRNLQETDSYEFPSGTMISAGGFLLLVPVAPEDFRALHGVPPSVAIVGPSGGALANGGEELRLSKPTASDDGVSFVLIDRVHYDDVEPWASDADGSGPSLERIWASDYGNEPLNWEASHDVGGTPGETNSVSQPGGNERPTASFVAVRQAELDPLAVLFDASDSSDPDGSIVSYDWTFGDGETGTGEKVTHIYPVEGTYTVRLTVTDDDDATGNAISSVTVVIEAGGGQIPGDSNQDSRVDISDAVSVLAILFLGRAAPCEGAMTEDGNRTLHDLNVDGNVDITDAVYLLTYLFQGGAAPVLGTACIRVEGCPDVCAP